MLTAEIEGCTYLPQDRRRALAHGGTSPDRTTGSALFAGIAGFTPLTEAMKESFGPRLGAEELSINPDANSPLQPAS